MGFVLTDKHNLIFGECKRFNHWNLIFNVILIWHCNDSVIQAICACSCSMLMMALHGYIGIIERQITFVESCSSPENERTTLISTFEGKSEFLI